MSLLSTKYRTGTKVQHQLFTSSGTWTKPAKFIEGTLIVTGIGGGASGTKIANISCGGNGGEFVVDKYVDVTASPSVSVTIGTGGASVTGTAPLAGNSGSPTTFGALLTLAGGVGASSGAIRAVSVGGSIGGVADLSSGLNFYAPPVPIQCSFAGSCGYSNAGDSTNSATNSGNGNAGGGNGLVLSDTGVKGGSATAGSVIVYGGVGYGAGGGSLTSNNSGAGAAGALYLTWQEYI